METVQFRKAHSEPVMMRDRQHQRTWKITPEFLTEGDDPLGSGGPPVIEGAYVSMQANKVV